MILFLSELSDERWPSALAAAFPDHEVARSPCDGGARHGRDGLAELCARADILVALLPSTKATRNFLDRSFFSGLRHGVALINVGRGDLVVEHDLLMALDEGRIRHAVLDVFRTEPLPADHPFWSHPKITTTPHNSAAINPTTAIEQVCGNLRRAFHNEALPNVVDPAVGY
ncbi:NAD(P)-dependent oxidoreductase [Mesorhizobium sp. L-8-3]|uniref:NAD(P)-dependent oxidoreductase n=1 Tax=Mesorhizobium sp. L-8-3 TaxID=2744522 RepID=UPI001926AA12|nr:NAD(P)-dependent oxidoreductase [Mesorhizobium sp. L-8-3]BCH27881.1 hypothetical protein MesoLjLb_76660 [Mesorhizobium sp. L-8-3]